MKIRYSERAFADLATIQEYQKQEWPGVGERFYARLVEVEQRIVTFPTGATAFEDRPDVYAAPEPSTWAMLCLGFTALGAGRYVRGRGRFAQA